MRLTRWQTLLPLAALVLLMHALLWQSVAASRGANPGATTPPPAVVQVRAVTLPPVATAATAPEPAAPRRVVRAPRPRPLPPPPLQVASPEDTPAPVEPPMAAPEVTLARAEPVVELTATRAGDSTSSAEPSVPTYRTRIAPAATLVYDLRRGIFKGRGELQWRPGDGRYTARLQGTLAGLTVLTWSSEGAFDAAGIAPLRFTDRRTRGTHAANFRRDSRTITFSGPSTEYPLLPGTQDRLSWMLQVPAIVSAAPARFTKGARINLFVAGARGDADVWVFQVRGMEDIALGDGSHLSALKLVREPRKEHDTHAEVWLDPNRHHLPVRARLTAGSDTLELLLQDASPLQ